MSIDHEEIRKQMLLDRINEIKKEKEGKEPTSYLPGIELLYTEFRDNSYVYAALSLWENHPEVTAEQALVQLVHALVPSHESLLKMCMDITMYGPQPVFMIPLEKEK